MIKKPSEIGEAIREVIGSLPKQSGDNMPPLHGWQQVTADLPSLIDMERVYRAFHPLIRGGEHAALTQIAEAMEEFRGAQPFEEGDALYSAIMFTRHVGSFLFTFGLNDPSVRMYCMGVSWQNDDRRAIEQLAHCSRMASDFEDRVETKYLDVRDAQIGKHGIAPAPKEPEWERCGFAPSSQ